VSRLKPQPESRPRRRGPPKRDRYQLVIALGEGEEGQRRREWIEAAAQGQPLSCWARDTLLAAAGAPLEGPASRAELLQVKAELDETVMQVNELFRMVTGRDR
jgi:hypothetical protein